MNEIRDFMEKLGIWKKKIREFLGAKSREDNVLFVFEIVIS